MGKEHKGHCSWGAIREGKGEIGLEGSRAQVGKWEFCSRHGRSEELEGMSGPIRKEDRPPGTEHRGDGLSQGHPAQSYKHRDGSRSCGCG